MIIIAILLAGLLGIWAYWGIRSRKIDRMTSSLPSLPTLPLLGNALLFLGNNVKLLQCIENFVALASRHKDVVKVWLGPKLYVAIANPVDAQVIQENQLDKDVVYRFLKPWLGHGLFIAPLNLWKVHRKVLLPVFHNKIVDEYIGIINEQSTTLVQRLSEKSGKGEFDVMSNITACTLDIVFETAMGERMNVQQSPDTPYLKARSSVIETINMRLFKVWLQPDCLFNLTSYAKKQEQNIHLTHKFTDEVVMKKRKQYEETKSHKQKSGWFNALAKQAHSRLHAVLDLLFGKEIEFTNEQLREHIDSITIAGNDTTALVISYSLVLLGIHQDAQEQAYMEQTKIFGEDDHRHATKDDLQNMHYLERVIKESMRLYTVVPIIARNVEKDTYLPYCGVTIPAGTGAAVASFAIHKNKKIWGDDADKFDPDRFLPERSRNRHPAAFQPFSFGARNCIGRNFGMLIIKCILSHFLRSYKIYATEVGPLKMEMLLFPIMGHQIRIVKRHGYNKSLQ